MFIKNTFKETYFFSTFSFILFLVKFSFWLVKYSLVFYIPADFGSAANLFCVKKILTSRRRYHTNYK